MANCGSYKLCDRPCPQVTYSIITISKWGCEWGKYPSAINYRWHLIDPLYLRKVKMVNIFIQRIRYGGKSTGQGRTFQARYKSISIQWLGNHPDWLLQNKKLHQIPCSFCFSDSANLYIRRSIFKITEKF